MQALSIHFMCFHVERRTYRLTRVSIDLQASKMLSTIPNKRNPTEKQTVKPEEKTSGLICKVKYTNTLPDIPLGSKSISYPFDVSRFIQYKLTSLESNYRHEVLTERDLGMNIDLINKDIYKCKRNVVLDPADEKLLEEDDVVKPQDSKRSQNHAKGVSWLKRPEYICTEPTRYQSQTIEKVEAKVGYGIKKNLKNEEILYMDRDSQIKAIEKTFEDSLEPIKRHHSKPNVVPVEVLPVYPDFKLWKHSCAQVMFDSDPAPVGKEAPAQIEKMSQAIIRGVTDGSGEQFVAHFLPVEETFEKRREDLANQIPYQDDEEYEYKMAKEYDWNVTSKAIRGYEENYFFVIRQDGAYYNELETKVRLSKRRQKGELTASNTKLVVKHRPMDAAESRLQRHRKKQLEPEGKEEESPSESRLASRSKLKSTSGSESSSRTNSISEPKSTSRRRVAWTASSNRSDGSKSGSSKSSGYESNNGF